METLKELQDRNAMLKATLEDIKAAEVPANAPAGSEAALKAQQKLAVIAMQKKEEELKHKLEQQELSVQHQMQCVPQYPHPIVAGMADSNSGRRCCAHSAQGDEGGQGGPEQIASGDGCREECWQSCMGVGRLWDYPIPRPIPHGLVKTHANRQVL